MMQDVTHKIKARIAVAKAAFNKKKALFTSKVDLNLRQELVKRIWSTALYSAESWILQKADLAVPWKFQNLVLEWTEKTSWNNGVKMRLYIYIS
jgi:hypothetical protein